MCALLMIVESKTLLQTILYRKNANKQTRSGVNAKLSQGKLITDPFKIRFFIKMIVRISIKVLKTKQLPFNNEIKDSRR